MSTPGVTYEGIGAPNPATLLRLPERLARILAELNGFVAYRGGFHLRGSCEAPKWHSLEEVWFGSLALHRLFPAVRPDDIPFAQDCVADQWLLRDGRVCRLASEYGEVESLGLTLDEFFDQSRADPLQMLGLHPLHSFLADGGHLDPGFVLQAAPPFCMKGEGPVSLRPIPVEEAISYLSDLARQLRDVKDGESVTLRTKP